MILEVQVLGWPRPRSLLIGVAVFEAKVNFGRLCSHVVAPFLEYLSLITSKW